MAPKKSYADIEALKDQFGFGRLLTVPHRNRRLKKYKWILDRGINHRIMTEKGMGMVRKVNNKYILCLLYTSDAADE